MSAGSRIRVLISVALLAAVAAWSQDGRQVVITPDRPEAGSAFTVEVTLPGERPQSVSALDPAVRGPARYTGADVRPGRADQAPAATVIEYRFISTGVGRIDIVDLSARSGARLLHLGSWSLDAVAGAEAPVRRYGSWNAPASVTVRDVFVVAALDPDGRPADCPTFAVEGALLEPVPGAAGSFRAVAVEPGTLRLPRLMIGGEADGFEIGTRIVAAKAVPAAGSSADAVGGPWRLELSEPRAGATAEPGQVIAWDVRATGRGWPGLASAPSLTIYGPDGLPVQTGDGTSYSGTAGNASGCYSGARGAFTARFPGTYIITPEPFRWFDPSAGVLRTALAQAVRVTVAPPPVVAWEAPEYAKDFAVKTLTRLAAADSSWASALDAANRSDWLAARSEAFRASGVGEVKGSLPSATVRGTGAADRASAVAAAGLLAGDRAEAYAAFLRLERTAFPPRGVSSMADIAAASFGNLDRVSYVLPPFGWSLAAASVLAASLLVLAVAARIASRRTVSGSPGAVRDAVAPAPYRRLRAYAVAFGLATAVALSLAGASLFERTRPRFVCLGGTARTVPSALAESGRDIEPGVSGRILRFAGDWSFVEFDDGSAAWLSSGDIVRY